MIKGAKISLADYLSSFQLLLLVLDLWSFASSCNFAKVGFEVLCSHVVLLSLPSGSAKSGASKLEPFLRLSIYYALTSPLSSTKPDKATEISDAKFWCGIACRYAGLLLVYGGSGGNSGVAGLNVREGGGVKIPYLRMLWRSLLWWLEKH